MRRVLICGVGRSGTSLMQILLGTIPGVKSIPETGLLRRGVIGDVILRGTARPRFHPQYERIGLVPSNGTIDRQVLLDTYVRATSDRGDGASAEPWGLVVDKDPRLIEWLPVLTELLGDVKVLLLVRDPRAVVASKQRAAWSAGRSVFRMELEAEIQASIALAHLEGADDDRVLLVPFSGLVTDPLKTLNRVLRWLDRTEVQGIDADERARVASRLVADEEMPWKGRVHEPVQPGRADAWTQQLNASDKSLVEGLAHAQFELCQLAGERLSSDVDRMGSRGRSIMRTAHQAGVRGFVAYRRYQHRQVCKRLESGLLGARPFGNRR